MKLRRLLKDINVIECKGSKDVVITGICSHSKLCLPGNVFIARRGSSSLLSNIQEAIQTGASAIVIERLNPFLKGVTQVVVKDISLAEKVLSSTYYKDPSKDLFMIGVTGTNGKTTTSYLLHHMLSSSQKKQGLLGTILYQIGEKQYPATLTTPDLLTNQKLLREMVNKELDACVMEVSSHALSQNRVSLIDFDIGVFTNLTAEHLDYHSSMEEYALSKQKLFDQMSQFVSKKKYPKTAIINQDCIYGQKLNVGALHKITYGIENNADIRATNIKYSMSGTKFDCKYFESEKRLFSPLVGKFNVYNVLAAIASCLEYGMEMEVIEKKIRSFSSIPGRLEKIKSVKGTHIFVDYAHTDNALENVLQTLKNHCNGKLYVVFGAGGDRDKEKRSRMGCVASNLADFSIITSDNPRSEDPTEICEEIALGFNENNRYSIEIDRRKAIRSAMQMAQPEDVVLVAGKGHEATQLIHSQYYPFDDKEEIEKIDEEINEKANKSEAEQYETF